MKYRIQNMIRNMNPAVLVVLVLLIGNRFLNSNMGLGEWIYSTLLMLPAIIVALSFHEAAHGFMSHWLGDPTPKMQGRLTLNPASHIDPIGFLALLIAGFGWGRPVQINPAYYKNRRRDEFLVSIAGVATNFLLAVVAALLIKAFFGYGVSINSTMAYIILEILLNFIIINLVLMIFNLIPVPPLDGFGIVTQIFNLEKYDWYWKYYQNGHMILMLLIIFNITDMIISPCVNALFALLIY